MTWANFDQNSYMDYLATLPDAIRCWCGWFPAGKCHTCPVGKTLADRRLVQCQFCGNWPSGERGIIHRIGCPQEKL